MSGVLDEGFMGNNKGDGKRIVSEILKVLGLDEKEIEKLETIPYPELVDAYEKAVKNIDDPTVYKGQCPIVNDFYVGEPHIVGFTENAKTSQISLLLTASSECLP
jgi:para-nitrobenzyl esterase